MSSRPMRLLDIGTPPQPDGAGSAALVRRFRSGGLPACHRAARVYCLVAIYDGLPNRDMGHNLLYPDHWPRTARMTSRSLSRLSTPWRRKLPGFMAISFGLQPARADCRVSPYSDCRAMPIKMIRAGQPRRARTADRYQPTWIERIDWRRHWRRLLRCDRNRSPRRVYRPRRVREPRCPARDYRRRSHVSRWVDRSGGIKLHQLPRSLVDAGPGNSGTDFDLRGGAR